MEQEINRVINGHRYNTQISILIASEETHGQNTFLHRTKRGLFFIVYSTESQSDRPTLEPLTREEAIEWFNKLPKKHTEYKEAFSEIEEAAGRPPIYDKAMVKTALWLPEEMIAWLKAQPGTMSETVRNIINKAMKKS